MRRFIPLFLFAVGFALVEAAIVIYLRRLYYPDGFSFPLEPIPVETLKLELCREAATIVMLISVGVAAGKSGWQRLAYFMFSFGVWDIFYYVWLKVFIDWPESLFTPDVLFLIPVVWWGPVLAPVAVAVSLCASSLILVRMEERLGVIKARRSEVAGVVIGAVIILYTFMADAFPVMKGEMPPPFMWCVFFAGEGVGIAAFTRMLARCIGEQEQDTFAP